MRLSRLLKFAQRQECLKWWDWALGADFVSALQFFSPSPGRRGSHYPSPESSSVLLEIGECRGAYAAYATEELTGFYETIYLEWSDVQAFHLNSSLILSHLRGHFNVTQQSFPQLENLHPVGHCPVGRRSVYASLHPDSDKNLAIAVGLHDPEIAGCIIFPERIALVEPLLRARGIASIFLDEACPSTSSGCSKCCLKIQPDIANRDVVKKIYKRFDRFEATVRPSADRGVKTVSSASAGGYARGQQYQPKYAAARKFLKEYHRENPAVSFSEAMKKAASHVAMSVGALKKHIKKGDFTRW